MATKRLNHVYAMGGRPLLALNVVGFRAPGVVCVGVFWVPTGTGWLRSL